MTLITASDAVSELTAVISADSDMPVAWHEKLQTTRKNCVHCLFTCSSFFFLLVPSSNILINIHTSSPAGPWVPLLMINGKEMKSFAQKKRWCDDMQCQVRNQTKSSSSSFVVSSDSEWKEMITKPFHSWWCQMFFFLLIASFVTMILLEHWHSSKTRPNGARTSLEGDAFQLLC